MPSIRLPYSSPCAADSRAVLTGETWRITVLTSRLLRLEYSACGRFTDKPTRIVTDRRFPVPAFSVQNEPDRLTVTTDSLCLTYTKKPFSPDSLSIRLSAAGNAEPHTWH